MQKLTLKMSPIFSGAANGGTGGTCPFPHRMSGAQSAGILYFFFCKILQKNNDISYLQNKVAEIREKIEIVEGPWEVRDPPPAF